MQRLLLAGAGFLGILLLAIAGGSHEPTPVDVDGLRAEIDAIAEEHVRVGAMIGVIDRNGYRRTFSYGSNSLNDSAPLDEDSLFDIGSITKTFTSTLLSEMELRGLVDLRASVGRYLPSERVTMPTFDGKEIELIHLATQTSGLPKKPQDSGYPKPPGINPLDHYAAYTTDYVYGYLSDYCVLEFEPGTKWLYSNTGSGLLGHVLGLIDGTSYWELLKRAILDELGMTSTFLFVPDERQPDLARGHNENNGYAPPYHANDIFQGAGFLKSSLADMFIFLEANLGLIDTPLAAALSATHRPRVEINADLGSIGLDWLVGKLGDRQEVVSHGGRTGGYGAYIGFNKKLQTGVIVLCNFSVIDVATEIGERVLQAIPKY
ncbi:serine hydrolase domain-containing protein [Candidatus Bipolaricaulota bacterium]